MQSQTRQARSFVALIRWTARLLSILSIAGLGFFMIGEKVDLFRFRPFELLEFLFFPVGMIVGLLIAWRRGAGGLASGVLPFFICSTM